MEKWVENQVIHAGPVFTVRKGTVRLDDGLEAYREVIEHDGGVGVAPVLGDKVILVRQYRVACGRYMLELPAGKLEGGEDPKTRARCELEEEIGYRAGELVHVAACYCSPGCTNEVLHIFLGFDLEKTEQRLEEDERIELVEVPIADLDRMLTNREIDDGKTFIGLRELLVYLEKHPERRIS